MANLDETSNFDAGVYQLELTDPVIGGPNGTSNKPLKNLANRTKWLKDAFSSLTTSVTEALTAKAPLASPEFTGSPKAPTPPHFDNDTSLANTAFVQRALGNYRTYSGLAGNNTLTAAEAGGLFEITSGSTGTTTLPNAADKAGLRFVLNNTSAHLQNIASSGGSFFGSGFSGVSTYSLPPTYQCEFISDGTNWKVIDGGYKCRAWVNFDGYAPDATSIRGSGNISSVAKLGTGVWAINFAAGFPDTNFAAIGNSDGTGGAAMRIVTVSQYLPSQVILRCSNIPAAAATFPLPEDTGVICLSVFR